MRNLKISYGGSRFSKRWTNKTITFENLCKRLETTVRTTETQEEYLRLPKGERDKIKDIGGFVGGWLKGGRRKNETLECRSMLTLDADHATMAFLDDYGLLCPNATVVYSTHGHTPDMPRLRFIIPLTRDVTPDEYGALARFITAEFGIDQFDECSYRPHQLMYWPSAPINGEYVFKKFEGAWLNPNDILAAHPHWRDITTLPTSSRESKVIAHEIKRQADPLAKDGLIGAYNNVHFPMQTFIETQLSDIYEPVGNGRYGFKEADSTAGGVVYDDKFFYSNHASDPAYGRLLNAFDLMRVHRFGHLEEKESVKVMLDEAGKDETVNVWLAEKRFEQARGDFAECEDWRTKLELDKSGAVKESFGNYLLILNRDPALVGIAFNQMRDGIDTREDMPWKRIKPGWNETDGANLYEYLQTNYGIYSPTKANHAVLAAAAKRVFHPIREYLNSLPDWDGNPRVETLIIDYFGAEDNAYVRAVTRKTFAAAVARIFQPGVKFDYMLILNGRTGLGKSTFFDKLAGEWFSDSLTFADMGKGKDAPEKIQGFWIIEIPEMAGIRKTDVNNVKAFISRRDDNYRASYGHNSESHPRQCIIVGSTNSESMGFLRDVTGNRRFWPVRVSGAKALKGWDVTDADVIQIWAEAKKIWEGGEKLFLENDIIDFAESAQREALEMDEREGMVREYLDTLLPENWASMSIYDRRAFIVEPDNPTLPVGEVRRDIVCNMEIWCECFGRRREDFERTESYKIISIMEKIGGWERYDKKKRMGEYGIVPVWVRVGVS